MALKVREVGFDHRGEPLPEGICAVARQDNSEIVSFKDRWREQGEDGIERQRSKSFSVRSLESHDRALDAGRERALHGLLREQDGPPP